MKTNLSKLLSIKKTYFSILILLFTMQLSAQPTSINEIPTYWLDLKLDRWTYKHPEVAIFKFYGNKLYLQEFDTVIETAPLDKDGNIPDSLNANVRFVKEGENHLLAISRYTDENGKKSFVEDKYVKLVPTAISDPNFKEEKFITFKFRAVFNAKKNVLYFNKKMDLDDMPHLFENHLLGDEIRLEKIDEYYFLSFYLGQERYQVIPIQEIHENGITVYGVNETDERVFCSKIN